MLSDVEVYGDDSQCNKNCACFFAIGRLRYHNEGYPSCLFVRPTQLRTFASKCCGSKLEKLILLVWFRPDWSVFRTSCNISFEQYSI